MILMLEDDVERISRFEKVIRRIDRTLVLQVWHNAHQMIREVAAYLPQAKLLSLDNDLEPWPGEEGDPGDGVIVVKALTLRPQCCPVIIHSSNRTRSDWMAGDLELAGWNFKRVAPIGDRWIEEYWRAIALELLREYRVEDRSVTPA
jgi:hypothetical protein